MWPYTLVACIAYSASVISSSGRRTSALEWLGLATYSLVLVLFIGLRFEVGKDWVQYNYIFDEIAHLPFREGLYFTDPGYSLLNFLSSRSGFGIIGVNIVCAGILVTGIFMFAARTPYPWMAVAATIPHIVTVMAMDHVRQATALGLILVALSFLARDRVRAFVIFSLLAVMFHKTSLLVLALGLVAISRNRVLVASVMAVAFVAVGSDIWNDRFQIYMERYIETGAGSRGAILRVISNATPAALFLWLRMRFRLATRFDKTMKLLAWCAILSAVALPFSPSEVVVDRISKYFLPVQLLFFSMALAHFRHFVGRMIVALAIVLYFTVTQFYWLHKSPLAQDFWLPYKMVDI